MPVRKQKRISNDPKSLKEKLDAKAEAKDATSLCRLVQEDLGVGGTATYNISPRGEHVKLDLVGGVQYFVFIIYGGFTVGNDKTVYLGNGVGHFVSQESVLQMEPGTAVVIVSGS